MARRECEYVVLPHRRGDAGLEYLVRDDGSAVRGRWGGGNIAGEACEELARASGFHVRFHDLLFLGVPDQQRAPLLYPYTADLTGAAQESDPEDLMVWLDGEQMEALGRPETRGIGFHNQATAALYGRLRPALVRGLCPGCGPAIGARHA